MSPDEIQHAVERLSRTCDAETAWLNAAPIPPGAWDDPDPDDPPATQDEDPMWGRPIPPGSTDAYQRGQRDLAAKVEALAEEWQAELDGGRILDQNARYCWGLAASEVRRLLADALPQDADSEPASVPTTAREGENVQDHAGEGERPADRRTAAQEGDQAALEYLMRVQRSATSDDVREIAAELEAELRAKMRDGGAGL